MTLAPMVSFRQFDPSEDVLQAIQSLRDEDRQLEAAMSQADETVATSSADAPQSRSAAVVSAYHRSFPGVYLRARV